MTLFRQGDEVTVACFTASLSPNQGENRQISGCRQGVFHHPLSTPSVQQKQTTKSNGQLLGQVVSVWKVEPTSIVWAGFNANP
jgi:hypothetical protein